MTTEQALAALGVRPDTLREAEKRRLDEDGFLPIPDVFSGAQADALARRLDELLMEEGDRAGTEVHKEAGTDRLSDLVNKGEIFRICFTHPRVLAGIAHVLQNDIQLSSLNARAALPGCGLQPLHADWSGAVAPGDYSVCNSIWLIDDFTEDNGATRMVPGSHRSGRTPRDEMPDPAQPHPREILLTARRGTVVVFNSHVWHGGTLNRSARPRRALHSYFCRRAHKQQLDQQRCLRPETSARLSPAERHILGVAES